MRRRSRVRTIGAVGLALSLLACSDSGDSPSSGDGDIEDRGPSPGSTVSMPPDVGTQARDIAAELSCRETTDVSSQVGNIERVVDSFDCDMGASLSVRVHTFDDPGARAAAQDRLGYRYGEGTTAGCGTDPIVVSGAEWLAVAFSSADAELVADELGGTIVEQDHHGPIVSYMPPSDACDA